jgi:lysyl-tRNA synthetase class 2
MATLKDFRDERLRKLTELKELGVSLYPATSSRTHDLVQIVADFDNLEDTIVTVVGRIKSIRKFGKLAFVVIRDDSHDVQLFFKEDESQKCVADRANSELCLPSEVALLDSGDFVECTGKVIKTQTGEISVSSEKVRLLTKALRPLPSELEGFTNKEERLRRRYVDLNVNNDVYQRFIRRSKFWQSTREYLIGNGFLEINIPVLEGIVGGADANPFVTHMDALDQDFYLRISHELPLKRLLVGGYEKVFDIGPRFRNENYSDEHLPEHVAMEWYWAYADWKLGMKFTQGLVRFIAQNTWNKTVFTLADGEEVDLGESNDWPLVSFVKVIKDSYGIDVFETTISEVSGAIKDNKLEVEKTDSIARGLDKLWKNKRKEIVGPAFLVDIPAFLQPLAKLQSSDNRLTEQFNLLIGGTEVCKAYSELNDPIDQYGRFLEQAAMREAGDNEAQMMDIDFVEALEYGMPPACGYGHSERLFWILEGVSAREGVPFPQLKTDVDETTKSLYPELYS